MTTTLPPSSDLKNPWSNLQLPDSDIAEHASYSCFSHDSDKRKPFTNLILLKREYWPTRSSGLRRLEFESIPHGQRTEKIALLKITTEWAETPYITPLEDKDFLHASRDPSAPPRFVQEMHSAGIPQTSSKEAQDQQPYGQEAPEYCTGTLYATSVDLLFIPHDQNLAHIIIPLSCIKICSGYEETIKIVYQCSLREALFMHSFTIVEENNLHLLNAFLLAYA